MEVNIDRGELYPNYSLAKARPGETKAEVPEELFRRYEAARKEYEAVQDLLEPYWEKVRR